MEENGRVRQIFAVPSLAVPLLVLSLRIMICLFLLVGEAVCYLRFVQCHDKYILHSFSILSMNYVFLTLPFGFVV